MVFLPPLLSRPCRSLQAKPFPHARFRPAVPTCANVHGFPSQRPCSHPDLHSSMPSSPTSPATSLTPHLCTLHPSQLCTEQLAMKLCSTFLHAQTTLLLALPATSRPGTRKLPYNVPALKVRPIPMLQSCSAFLPCPYVTSRQVTFPKHVSSCTRTTTSSQLRLLAPNGLWLVLGCILCAQQSVASLFYTPSSYAPAVTMQTRYKATLFFLSHKPWQKAHKGSFSSPTPFGSGSSFWPKGALQGSAIYSHGLE